MPGRGIAADRCGDGGMLLDKGGVNYMIGFDLRDDACQISYCSASKEEEVQEPVTYASPEPEADILPGDPGAQAGSFDIPTALAKRVGINQWCHGKEAALRAADASWIFVPHLLTQALEGRFVVIEDVGYDPSALLALYISRCLNELSGVMPDRRASTIMFTSSAMDARTIEVLENVRRRLDFKSAVYYQSYGGSYYDFMLNQPQELREPASALFEYETGGKLRIRKLIFNIHTHPMVAFEEESEYPGLLAEDDGGRDEEFSRILKEELVGRNYAASYLIGSGFKGGWMRKSSRILCSHGRRAFLGANLFSKGAAYGAMFKALSPAILSDYFYLDENKLGTNVLLQAYEGGVLQEVTLVEAGVNWYEVRGRRDLILESTGEINLLLKPLTGGAGQPYHIRLEGLPVREGRITRIRLDYAMSSAKKLIIRMTDLGFGELFPSSGLKWEQRISV